MILYKLINCGYPSIKISPLKYIFTKKKYSRFSEKKVKHNLRIFAIKMTKYQKILYIKIV